MSQPVEIRFEEQTEGTRSQILRWLKAVGDSVSQNEPLIEIETDKVTVEVPSPGSGTLREILKEAQEEIAPGDLLGRIDAEGVSRDAASSDGASSDADSEPVASGATSGRGTPASGGVISAAGERVANGVGSPSPGAGVCSSDSPSSASGVAHAVEVSQTLSPAVRRLLTERGLQVSDVRGTGQGGRVTVADVLAHQSGRVVGLNQSAAGPSGATAGAGVGDAAAAEGRSGVAVRAAARAASKAPVGTTGATSIPEGTSAVASSGVTTSTPSHRIPHTATRKRIAEHMVQSLLHTAPHVTTVFEADLSAVLEHRQRNKDDFAKRNVPLTLTAYLLQAAVSALRAVPEANSRWTDADLEVFDSMHIGVATALETGLVVPVLRDVQSLDLFETARGLDDLVSRARDGRLSPSDMRGGTFTLSNHGVSGSLVATPIIINQPQSAILGVGKLEKRPVVVSEGGEDRLVIRPQCYVTLTIDHRVMDGHQANRFLQTFVQRLASSHW